MSPRIRIQRLIVFVVKKLTPTTKMHWESTSTRGDIKATPGYVASARQDHSQLLGNSASTNLLITDLSPRFHLCCTLHYYIVNFLSLQYLQTWNTQGHSSIRRRGQNAPSMTLAPRSRRLQRDRGESAFLYRVTRRKTAPRPFEEVSHWCSRSLVNLTSPCLNMVSCGITSGK